MFHCPTCDKRFKKEILYKKHISQSKCNKSSPTLVPQPEPQPIPEEEEPKIKEIGTNTDGVVLEEIMARLLKIEERQEFIIKNIKFIKSNNIKIKNVKKERMNTDKEVALSYLDNFHVESDAELLYSFYLKDKKPYEIPIRLEKKNEYKYYDEEWITDKRGLVLKNIFGENLKKLYLRSIPNESNQAYIQRSNYLSKMSEIGYRNKLLDIFTQKYL